MWRRFAAGMARFALWRADRLFRRAAWWRARAGPAPEA
jgi:hypothetical protein